MKLKMLLLVFTLMILFSNIDVASAGNIIKEENKNVTVGDVELSVFEVNIIWGTMEFTLNEEMNYVWEDTTKTYELVSPTYSWIVSNNYIDITNNSHRNIKISLVYNSLYNNIQGSFNKARETIAVNNNTHFELNLSGSINTDNNIVKVGTVDLLIS